MLRLKRIDNTTIELTETSGGTTTWRRSNHAWDLVRETVWNELVRSVWLPVWTTDVTFYEIDGTIRSKTPFLLEMLTGRIILFEGRGLAMTNVTGGLYGKEIETDGISESLPLSTPPLSTGK